MLFFYHSGVEESGVIGSLYMKPNLFTIIILMFQQFLNSSNWLSEKHVLKFFDPSYVVWKYKGGFL